MEDHARVHLRSLSILLTVLAICCTLQAQTRWRAFPIRSQQQYNDGLVGGAGEQFLHGIARSPSDPQVIYLSHDCGQIWRSDNNGDLWYKPKCAGMWVKAGQSIEVDPVDPYTVFAVADSSSDYISRPYEGLFRSFDGGENWELVLAQQGDSVRQYQHNIAYDPMSIEDGRAQRWCAAFSGASLFLSDDGGDTWNAGASLSSHTTVLSVKYHNSDSQTIFVGSSEGLYRSSDGGATLAPCGNLPAGTISCMATHPDEDDTLFVVVSGTGLYKSTDGGDTFSTMMSTDAVGVYLNDGYPDIIYLVSSSNNIRVSKNGGDSWSFPNFISPEGLQRESRDTIRGSHSCVVPNPQDPDEAVAHGEAMMWKTTNGAASFYDGSMLFTGYNGGWWNDWVAYDISDPDRFIFFLFDVGMVETENGGIWFERHKLPYTWYTSGLLSWRSMHAGDLYPVTGSDYFIAGAGQTFNTRLVSSANYGDSYTLINDHEDIHLFIAFNTDNPDIVYAGDQRSTDGGTTFSEVPYLDTIGGTMLGMCRAQPNTVYAINSGRNQIHRSDDAGATWRLYVQATWSFRRLDSKPCFAAHPTNPDIIYTLDSSGDAAMYDGTTWTSLNAMDAAEPTAQNNHVYNIMLDPRYPDIMYVKLFAPGGSQMLRSTDAGDTWTDITYNLPRVGGGTFTIHPLTGDVMFTHCPGTRVLPAPYADANSLYYQLPGEPTVARAGDDITVYDYDGNGFEMVSLDGSGSYSLDSGIMLYEWSIDGVPKSSQAIAQFPLQAGVYEVVLRAVDYDYVSDEDTLTVTVISALPGDANNDGQVNLDDFIILKQNYGYAEAQWPQGDFNGDGSVNLDDFIILKQNYGSSAN